MSDILDHAIAHHRQGRLAEAIALYEQSLAEAPHPHVQHLAGMAYYALENFEQAERYLGLAAAAANRGDYFFGHGNALHALKRYSEAYAAFQKAVAFDSANAALWFNLANSARFVDVQMARMGYSQAISLGLTQAYIPLALLMLEAGDVAAYAELLRQAYRTAEGQKKFSELVLVGAPRGVFSGESGAVIFEALKSFPRDYGAQAPDANRALAILFALGGDEQTALACLAATADDPDAAKIVAFTKSYLGLGERYGSDLKLFDLLRQAYPASRHVINAALLFALGMENRPKTLELLQSALGESFIGPVSTELLLETALKYFSTALEGQADAAASYIFLSRVLEGHNKIPDALEAARRAQRVAPESMEANLQLARMAHRFDLDVAEEELEKALALNPKSPDLLNYLGNIKMRRGDMAAALDYYARARAHIGPANGEKYELQLVGTLFTNSISGQLSGDMHKAWGDALIAKQKHRRLKYGNLEPKTKLKVGYLSADFWDSAPAYFFMPLFENHDPEKIEVYFYSSLSSPDLVTRRVQHCGQWRDISSLSDAEAIERIRKDDIDILVDLLGQNQGLRPVIFARKAAPVQVTWLGYPATSGLSTIDYRFTDAVADPLGMTESFHAEELYRLPHFLCYQPQAHTPAVNTLPALDTGFVTFGCFNKMLKITDEAVALWAQIMARVPNSRMIVKAAELGDLKTLVAFQEKFSVHGVEAKRIQYHNQTNFKFDHLTVYNEVDLTLDPFPYNGTTTTFESLWMGVPLITLEGDVHVARVGCAILAVLGLDELIAPSVEEYLEKAVALALDLPRLAAYRAKLRNLLQGSPLMDGKGFARSVEKAYAEMWRRAVEKSRGALSKASL